MVVTKLRRKLRKYSAGTIQNYNRIGYRLKIRKKKVVTLPITEEIQEYASEMECAIRGILSNHTEVGFESQVAILGVAIGAILHQLPKREYQRYTRVLMKNIANAPNLSQIVRMQ